MGPQKIVRNRDEGKAREEVLVEGRDLPDAFAAGRVCGGGAERHSRQRQSVGGWVGRNWGQTGDGIGVGE